MPPAQEQAAPKEDMLTDSITTSDTDTTMSSGTGSSASKLTEKKEEKCELRRKETERSGLASHIGAFISSWHPRALARPSLPSEGSRPEVDVLQEILSKKEEELNKLQKENDRNRMKFEPLCEELRRAKGYIARLKHHHREEVGHLQDRLAKYKINAETSRDLIEELEAKAKENEAQLSKAYSSAMSTWAQDVSRDMPDDVIRSTISSFFQGDFFSWCADMCASEIDWSRGFEHTLDCYNLVNRSGRYHSGPAHLLFNYEAPDGSGSLVLLQAALAKSLVNAFLRNPYFLLDDGTVLQKFERTFAERSVKEATNWRVNTVRNLEKAFPLHQEQAEVHVQRFLSTFGFLLQNHDQAALKDLADLFTRFSQIALKLWQTPTLISIWDLDTMADCPFQMCSPYMECEPVVASALRERLNGRPIGVVIRPCIVSNPIPESGEQAPSTIWSKALVWVSVEKDPYDVEE